MNSRLCFMSGPIDILQLEVGRAPRHLISIHILSVRLHLVIRTWFIGYLIWGSHMYYADVQDYNGCLWCVSTLLLVSSGGSTNHYTSGLAHLQWRSFKAKRNNNSKRRQVSQKSMNSIFVPVDFAPVGCNFKTTAAATVTVKPPSSWETDGRPIRLRSIEVTYAAPAPASLTVTLWSGGIIQLSTMPIVASTTTQMLRLRMPRHTDFQVEKNMCQFTTSGPMIIAGIVRFCSKQPAGITS